MKTFTTEELLSLLAQKDNKAFHHLYSLYFTALRNVALNYVKNDAAAEDLAQEVFIVLLESSQSFECLDQVRYFLYGVLKNKCISQLRKKKVRKRYMEEAIQEDRIMADFEDKVLEEDVYAHLMTVLEKLPPRCKLVMELSIDGLKRADISKRLSISIETVKEHRTLGRKRLAELLKHSYNLFF